MAITAQGSTFEVTISSTLTEVAEVMSISPVGQTTNLIDSTHLGSTSREYIGGLGDGLELTVSGNYVSNDAGQEFIRDNLGATNAVVITNSAGDTAAFSAVLLSYQTGPFEVESKQPFECSIKISGDITWTEA